MKKTLAIAMTLVMIIGMSSVASAASDLSTGTGAITFTAVTSGILDPDPDETWDDAISSRSISFGEHIITNQRLTYYSYPRATNDDLAAQYKIPYDERKLGLLVRNDTDVALNIYVSIGDFLDKDGEPTLTDAELSLHRPVASSGGDAKANPNSSSDPIIGTLQPKSDHAISDKVTLNSENQLIAVAPAKMGNGGVNFGGKLICTPDKIGTAQATITFTTSNV